MTDRTGRQPDYNPDFEVVTCDNRRCKNTALEPVARDLEWGWQYLAGGAKRWFCPNHY